MSVIAFSKTIGPVRLNCFFSENHNSELGITENPVESGGTVHDHAYTMPKKVTLEIMDENAAGTFNALVAFQRSRIPFTLVTGLSVYPSMLIRNISADRDKQHSQILYATVDLQEVIIAQTAVASIDVQDAGPVSTGEPGGANSTSAASPSYSSAGDSITADRATATIQRGDSPATTLTLPESDGQAFVSAALFPG